MRNNERVEFFQDFQDEGEDDTVINESQLISMFHLNIVELKVAKKKLQEQNLS